MRAGAAAAKAAKVGIAFVVSPAAGLREAGVALVDTLVKSDPEMKLALNQVTAELTGLARARGFSYEQSRTAFRSMQDLLEFHKLSVDELAALGFDPVRATSAQLAKGAPLMRTLSQEESDLTQQALLSLYRAVLSNPKLLPGRDEAFQRRVLAERERLALPEHARAQPVNHLRARGLEPAVGVPLSSRGSPAKAIQARAGSGVIPFVDRGRILETLCDWVGDEDPFAIVVVGGRGGSGKTRLAVELCVRAQDSGWLTGLLQLEPPAEALPALANAEAMRLIVIDYAETRIAQLVSLLPLLWARATRLYPVRVVLLVRTRPARGRDWRTPLTGTGDANLGNLLDDADVFEIETTDLPDRVEVYHQAFAGLMSWTAARDGVSPQPAPGPVGTPDLSAPVFDNPLMVVIAAYLAVHHDPESVTPPPRRRPELLEELLAHEARFWYRQWAEAGLTDGDAILRSRVVALATLAGARDEDDAATLLTLLPDMATELSGRIRAIARWGHHLYADIGSLWWNPLQPDVLGEHLVAVQVGAIPSVIAGVLDRNDPRVLTHALGVLARAAADDFNLRAVLGPLLAGRLQSLCRLAVEQAADVRGEWHTSATTTLAGALTRALITAPVDDPAVLREASRELPPRSDLVLGLLALVMYDQLVVTYRRLAKENLADYEPDLATSLTNLSIRLAEVGRRPEALAAVEEAVTSYRRLVAGTAAAYEPELARSLTTLSINLAEVGRRPEALAAVEEAVTSYRRLATANPAAHKTELATALANLSIRLAEVGRRPEALAAVEEAVTIRRRLVAANPAAYEPDLAASLTNLSVHLAEAGRRPEALAAVEEAVTSYRRLATANPAAHEPDLAAALGNLSIRLAEAGRRPEALAAVEEAVTIRRRLVAANPAAYEPDLAASLTNLSLRLAEAGRRSKALAANEEAVTIRRRLVAADPAAYEPDLAASLTNLSVRLAMVGRRPEALVASEEAVTTYRRLMAGTPAAYKPELAASLTNLSIRLAEVGRRPGALAAIEEAVTIRRRLVAENPAAFEPELARSLTNQSIHLAEAGRQPEALAANEEAVTIRRRLVAENPAAYEPELARSLANLSTRLAEAGRQPEALAANEEAVTTYRRLATANPAAYETELAASLTNLSTRLAEAGRQLEALAASEEAVTTYRRLVAANFAADEPDLAASLTILSVHLAAAGRRPEALAAVEEAVTTYRQLVATNPGGFGGNLASSQRVLEWLLSEGADEQGGRQVE